ncbi:MAG: agmatine deiminase family protein [Bacteroidetes bacterium]|nr:MAG: agmatine deiminase family protein [Bacteroidota bacterium]
MKNYLLLSLFLSQINIAYSQSAPGQYSFPAEFEKIDVIWMGWGITTYTDTATKDEVERIHIEMLQALSPYVRIRLIVTDSIQSKILTQKFLVYQIDTSKITYFFSPNWHFWLRDYGPIFVRNSRGQLKGVDFGFNCYGDCRTGFAKTADMGDSIIASSLGLQVIKSNIVSEGGDREFNGKGVMITNEAVELQRNPGKTKQQLEAEYKRVLGVKKVIWLKYASVDDSQSRLAGKLPTGVYSAGGTGGHVDEICRFADERTLLVERMTVKEKNKDSLSQLNYKHLEANYNILKNATDQDGKPFKIIEMPVPDFIIDKHIVSDKSDAFSMPGTIPGDTIRFMASASYMNFVIANGVVLMPKYSRVGFAASQKEKDDRALQIMKEIFPGKKIVQIDTIEINFGGGGMHCLTQQQPGTTMQ